MQIEGHLGPNIALIEGGVRRAELASHLAEETDDGHGPLVNRNRALSVLICPSRRAGTAGRRAGSDFDPTIMATQFQDDYETLGVAHTASADDIKKA